MPDPDPNPNPFIGVPPPDTNPFQGHTNKTGSGFVDETLPVNMPGERPWRAEIPKEEVIPEIGKTIYKTITEDIPGSVKKAASAPGQYAKDVAMLPINMIKSTLGVLGLPFITGPAYGVLKGGEALGVVPPRLSESFHHDYIKPGTDTLDEMQRKYGSWLGGPGNWGWTPEKGWENLKRTLVETPFEAGADVVSAVGPKIVRTIQKHTPAGSVNSVLAAAQRLENMGIDTKTLNQGQIDRLRTRGNEVGWSKDVMQREHRQLLFDEFGVTPNESMLSSNEAMRKWIDDAREGVYGEAAAIRVNEAIDKNMAQVEASTNRTRTSLTGAQDRMTPAAVGDTVTTRYNAADDAAKAGVEKAYDAAFDPAARAAAGVPDYIPEASLAGLPAALDARLRGAKKPFVATGETAPNTLTAYNHLNEYARTGRLPNIIGEEPLPPGGAAGVAWESADEMRKYLVGLRETSRANPIDYHGMTRVIDAFDKQFGKANSLLNDARALHSERMKTFHPDEWRAGDDVVKVTEALSNNLNNGVKQFNKLFSTEFNKGEAIGAINHLKQIFANDPAAMQAIKEGALEKMFMDQKDYSHLSPRQKATAMERALNGPQGDIYRTLFTEDELAMLRRHHAVVETVAEHTKPTNPPKSGQVEVRHAREEKSAETVNSYIKSLLTLGGTYLAPKYGYDPFAGSGAGFGAGIGAGQFLSGPLGKVYQSSILDPREAAKAGVAINPPRQIKPGMSRREGLGATVGGMSMMGSEEPPQTQPRARGGILRRLER